MEIMKKFVFLTLAFLGVVACSSESPPFLLPDDTDTQDTSSDTVPMLPTLTVADDFLPAADPKLTGFDGWPLRFLLEPGTYDNLIPEK